MAEHARFGSELLDDVRPLLAQRRADRFVGERATIGEQEVPDEELELPGQLLDVEGDAVRRIGAGGEGGPALLQPGNQPDRLAITQGAVGGRGAAEVRLQRHVAEVLQPDHAERVVVVEELGNRQRHLGEELGDADEGQRGVVDRAGMHGQHD